MFGLCQQLLNNFVPKGKTLKTFAFQYNGKTPLQQLLDGEYGVHCP